MKILFHRYIPEQGRCELVVYSDRDIAILTNVKEGTSKYEKRFTYKTMLQACRSFKNWDGTNLPPGIKWDLTNNFLDAREIYNTKDEELDSNNTITTAIR